MGIKNLLGSRKGALAAIGMVCVTVMACLDKLGGLEALGAITTLAAIYGGAQAFEDRKKKVAEAAPESSS